MRKRRRRKTQPTLKLINSFLTLALFYLATIYILNNYFPKINTLRILNGQQYGAEIASVTESHLLKPTMFSPQKNIYLFAKPKKLEKIILTEIPGLKDVSAKKKLKELIVEATPRSESYIFCNLKNECAKTDSEGILYEKYPNREGLNIVKIYSPEKFIKNGIVDPILLKQVSDILSEFEEVDDYFNPIKVSVMPSGSFNITTLVKTSQGFITNIYMSPRDNQDDYAEDLQNLLIFLNHPDTTNRFNQNTPSYIDARIKNKIYYKLNEK